jgi:hypothetical protein
MSESLLRKGAAELILKWRKTCRNNRSRGFNMTFAVCARDLEELLSSATALPNEDSWVDALVSMSGYGTDEQKSIKFRALLRTYRLSVLKEGDK